MGLFDSLPFLNKAVVKPTGITVVEAFDQDLRAFLEKYRIKRFTAVYQDPSGSGKLCHFVNPTVEARWTKVAAEEHAKLVNRLFFTGALGKK